MRLPSVILLCLECEIRLRGLFAGHGNFCSLRSVFLFASRFGVRGRGRVFVPVFSLNLKPPPAAFPPAKVIFCGLLPFSLSKSRYGVRARGHVLDREVTV